MQSLGQVADWPVGIAAAAVIGRDGVLESVGDVTQEFALASVTKLLTAMAVLVAVEEGTVGLDDPAGPEGSTVRHLLAHASGLAPDDAAQTLAGPGRKRIYSNAGFEVLAAHVESRAGLTFGQYATEAVVDPLDMADTALAGSPASGARSTVADLARFAAELMEPRLISAGTLGAATTVAFPGIAGVLPGLGRHDPNDWGLGFELRDNKQPHWTGRRNSERTFGHFGRSGTLLWVDPAAGIACVALTDREFGDWAIEAWPRLSDAVLAAWSPDSTR